MIAPFDLDGWRFTKPDWWRATHIQEPSLWVEYHNGNLGVVDTNAHDGRGGDYTIPLTVIDKLRELDDGGSVVLMDPRVFSLELLIESCVMNGEPSLLKVYRERLEDYLQSPAHAAWKATNGISD